ncbi:MAG: sigma-54 dependent transcriptional regulator [Candidatus Binatia bacterium]
MASILIVDDEKNIRTMLTTFVRERGHSAEAAADGAEALEALRRGTFEVVFSDVRMAGLDGLALLREIHSRWPEVVVVLMTAYATVAQAVEAMRAGAYDYLVKPFSIEEVALALDRVLEVAALRRENRALKSALERPVLLESRNPKMNRVIETARQGATSSATMLLTGESGTGKSVLARAIHGWSSRAQQPFVAIPCTTLSEHLLESELFGHVKGAFTGAWKDKVGRLEAADGGTLFLDEIGELPGPLQAKLLRFLEERRFERVGGTATIEVDARIVAATNRRLEAEVARGTFREDLFYRLNVLRIEVPPLRERLEDLPALARDVLAMHAARYDRPVLHLDAEAEAVLAHYRWPGNVRELVNVLEHAVVVCRGDRVRIGDLPDRLAAPMPPEGTVPADGGIPLEQVERRHIERVLADSPTLEDAAARLGISSTTLWRKRKRWGID